MKAKSFMGVLLALVMVITMVVLAPAAGAENSAATVDQQIGLLLKDCPREAGRPDAVVLLRNRP